MLLAPVLPSFAIANAAWKILNKLSARLARSANIAWPIAGSTGAADVTRAIAGAARATDITWPITGSSRPSNVAWPVAGLSRSPDIARPTTAGLSRASNVGSTAWTSRQLGCDIARAWKTTGTWELARTIAEKLCGSTAGQRAASKTRTEAWARRSSGWPTGTGEGAAGNVEKVLQVAVSRAGPIPGARAGSWTRSARPGGDVAGAGSAAHAGPTRCWQVAISWPGAG
jgi:hypothetical protein